MRGSSPLIASRATLALNAGEWLRLGLLGIFAAPPWSCASEQYHLSGCPDSPGHFSPSSGAFAHEKTSAIAVVRVNLFIPCGAGDGRITEGSPEGDDFMMFGRCDLG